jgi:hypothetical protein
VSGGRAQCCMQRTSRLYNDQELSRVLAQVGTALAWMGAVCAVLAQETAVFESIWWHVNISPWYAATALTWHCPS